MTKSNHYFQVVCHSYLGVKTIHLPPLILNTPINNVPSKTKWHNKVGEPLYTISGIPICLTFAKYNFDWESNLNGSCQLILIAFHKTFSFIGINSQVLTLEQLDHSHPHTQFLI